MSIGAAENGAAPNLLGGHPAETEKLLCGGHQRLRYPMRRVVRRSKSCAIPLLPPRPNRSATIVN
jgi:hypothetical protein